MSHGQSPRRSRKIVAWSIGVFFAIQLAGGAVVDYVIPSVRFPQLHRQLARLSGLSMPDLVVLGSSRFEGFVNDSELTHELREISANPSFRALNAAFPGGDPIAQRRMLREMLARGIRPRWLVAESSPEFLNRNTTFFYRLHIDRMLNWEDYREHAQAISTTTIPHLTKSRLLPLYQFRYQLLKQCENRFAEAAAAELAPRHPLTDGEWMAARNVARPLTDAQTHGIFGQKAPDQPHLQRYQLGGTAPKAVEQLLELCRDHQIRVVLVGAPTTSNYRAKYRPEFLAAYDAFLTDLRSQFDFAYVECRDAMPDHEFIDTHHAATPTSAIIFTRVLARERLASLLVPTGQPLPAQVVGFSKNTQVK